MSAPYLCMIGMTTGPDASESDLARFQVHYDNVRTPEVVAANPGFGTADRFQIDGETTGGVPGWLALYPIDSQASAEAYVARQEEPLPDGHGFASGPPVWESANIAWHAMWRLIAAEPSSGAVRDLLVAGIEPPGDLTDEELVRFNEFYDESHVPEIRQYGFYSGYARYELVTGLPGADADYPRYCTLYTADSADADLNRRDELAKAGMSGRLSAGPDVWQRRTSTWRTWWRPISAVADGSPR